MSVIDLIPRMTCYGTCARWNVNGHVFYQFAPAMTDPYRDVAPFLKKVVGLAQDGQKMFKGSLTPPGYATTEPLHVRLNSVPDWAVNDVVIDTMFRYWPEMAVRPPPRNAKIGFDWKVWWDVSSCEAAFIRYDPNGKPVPIHTIERKPLDEMIEELGATYHLGELVEWL